jgi:hypothetical protein
MGLTPGLSSAVDLFRKLQRDITRLDHELTDDHFFNLVITGYSLIDWVKHDPSLPAAARTPESIAGLHNESWLKVCGDLANASKHFVLTTRVPVTKEVTSKSGLGIGRYGKGAFGEGERDIEVHIDGAPTWSALEFSVGVLQVWIAFFKRHRIPVPPR